jgi:transposase
VRPDGSERRYVAISLVAQPLDVLKSRIDETVECRGPTRTKHSPGRCSKTRRVHTEKVVEACRKVRYPRRCTCPRCGQPVRINISDIGEQEMVNKEDRNDDCRTICKGDDNE